MSSPSVKDAALLILSQAATKGFTFITNQLLLRGITPEVFGIANYFEFVVNTVLFFSREAERMSVQRIRRENPEDTHKAIVNFAYLPFLLSWPIFGLIYLMQRSSDLYSKTITSIPNYHWLLVILVALVELDLLSEPFFSLSQFQIDMKIRSKAESLAVFMKCVVTFLSIYLMKTGLSLQASPVFAFALGHLAYSLTLYVLYWLHYTKSYPKVCKLATGEYLDRSIFPIWSSLSIQMIFKHLLTEGDTLLISYLFTASEQGVYSLISNYGSLLARLLFQPIEETLRVSMTKLFARKEKDYKESYGYMEKLTIFYTNLCVLVLLGGYSNGSYMLRCLLGNNANWQNSDVFSLFPNYIIYIPFMAFNGIFEGFLSSSSTHKEIRRFSTFMSILSIVVLGLLYVLIGKLNMGILGLVISNIFNMTLRIVYCIVYMRLFYSSKVDADTSHLLRRLLVPVLVGALAYVTQYALIGLTMTSTFKEFFLSLILCGLCLLCNMFHERNLLKELVAKKKKAD